VAAAVRPAAAGHPVELTASASSADGRPAGYPFRGPGLLARVGPFAAIAVLAEASLALPPGPASTSAAVASVVLLAAVAAAFLLRWSRLPGWMPVLVPLAYTGSVLCLILAAGTTSGVGIVILVPLIWTALFQQMWESACVVAAIVAVEVVISLTPVAVPDVVIARRVILWAALGTVLSVATHGLRDRIRRAREQAAQLQDRLREVSITEDRDRIRAGRRRAAPGRQGWVRGAAAGGSGPDRPAFRRDPHRDHRQRRLIYRHSRSPAVGWGYRDNGTVRVFGSPGQGRPGRDRYRHRAGPGLDPVRLAPSHQGAAVTDRTGGREVVADGLHHPRSLGREADGLSFRA
jgi:hypothetical protein